MPYTNSRMNSQKKGNANPSPRASSRKASYTKNQKTSGAGLQGLSVGQKVPMKMFEQPNKEKELKLPKPISSQTGVVSANKIKKNVKSALGKGQKKFMNI